jgi:hypothetical protein
VTNETIKDFSKKILNLPIKCDTIEDFVENIQNLQTIYDALARVLQEIYGTFR